MRPTMPSRTGRRSANGRWASRPATARHWGRWRASPASTGVRRARSAMNASSKGPDRDGGRRNGRPGRWRIRRSGAALQEQRAPGAQDRGGEQQRLHVGRDNPVRPHVGRNGAKLAAGGGHAAQRMPGEDRTADIEAAERHLVVRDAGVVEETWHLAIGPATDDRRRLVAARQKAPHQRQEGRLHAAERSSRPRKRGTSSGRMLAQLADARA